MTGAGFSTAETLFTWHDMPSGLRKRKDQDNEPAGSYRRTEQHPGADDHRRRPRMRCLTLVCDSSSPRCWCCRARAAGGAQRPFGVSLRTIGADVAARRSARRPRIVALPGVERVRRGRQAAGQSSDVTRRGIRLGEQSQCGRVQRWNTSQRTTAAGIFSIVEDEEPSPVPAAVDLRLSPGSRPFSDRPERASVASGVEASVADRTDGSTSAAGRSKPRARGR